MIEPYYSDEAVTLYHGDNREVLKHLDANSLDACVTDPPYELGFMGRKWDASGIAYDKYLWAEVWRVLKPGAHVLAFGGTRTWHRLAVAIEDAGFEVRDSLAWLFGSGFPKSLNLSKAIDKAAGAEREVLDSYDRAGRSGGILGAETVITRNITAPATDAARKWQGWGTALKPAFEPIVVARKPLIGTVAANVQQYGTGALNIDACRMGTSDLIPDTTKNNIRGGAYASDTEGRERDTTYTQNPAGRWPANVILDESQAEALDRQSGCFSGQVGMRQTSNNLTFGVGHEREKQTFDYGSSDFGGASRFFYTAKASTAERPRVDGVAHPTVKPLDLMQYLVRLVTPPGGAVLEPFAGSGTTLEACIAEGFQCIGIEMTDEYLPLIMQRITKPIEVTLL